VVIAKDGPVDGQSPTWYYARVEEVIVVHQLLGTRCFMGCRTSDHLTAGHATREEFTFLSEEPVKTCHWGVFHPKPFQFRR